MKTLQTVNSTQASQQWNWQLNTWGPSITLYESEEIKGCDLMPNKPQGRTHTHGKNEAQMLAHWQWITTKSKTADA
jgi:hypothetical protein